MTEYGRNVPNFEKKMPNFEKKCRISKFQHILEPVRILDFFNVDWHMC